MFVRSSATALKIAGGTVTGTTPALVFSSNAVGRTGFKFHNSSASGDNAYLTAVPSGTAAPTSIAAGTSGNLLEEVPPGTSFNGINDWDSSLDIYVVGKGGASITWNAVEKA